MNLVMKKVTSWAAIIAVLTAVTGFFGQNVPFLGFQSPLGLVLSLALIIVASTGLYLSFKKKEWICSLMQARGSSPHTACPRAASH